MKHFTPAAAALAICFAHSPAGAQKPVAPASASPRDDGNWTMPAKDYASTRYSELDQIDTGNVRNLQVAFTFPTETLKGQESAVLAVDGTLYFTTPYPNYVFAIDLTEPGGRLKWKFEPKPHAAAQGMACCQPVNRGPVYSDGAIYFNTIDAHSFALDAESGDLLWKTKVG